MAMSSGGAAGAPNLSDEEKAELRASAERRVQIALLLRAVAQESELEVVPEDLDNKFKELSEANKQPEAKVRAEYAGEKIEQLRSQILEEKVVDFLKKKVIIKEGAKKETTG